MTDFDLKLTPLQCLRVARFPSTNSDSHVINHSLIHIIKVMMNLIWFVYQVSNRCWTWLKLKPTHPEASCWLTDSSAPLIIGWVDVCVVVSTTAPPSDQHFGSKWCHQNQMAALVSGQFGFFCMLWNMAAIFIEVKVWIQWATAFSKMPTDCFRKKQQKLTGTSLWDQQLQPVTFMLVRRMLAC